MPDLYVNVFRINRTPKKDSLVQFLCFFLSQKKMLQDPCGNCHPLFKMSSHRERQQESDPFKCFCRRHQKTLLMTSWRRKQAFSHGTLVEAQYVWQGFNAQHCCRSRQQVTAEAPRPLHSRASVAGRDNTSHDMTRLLS